MVREQKWQGRCRWQIVGVAGTIAACLALRSHAQSQAKRPLSLDQALKLARQNSRDLKAAQERVRQAEAGIEQARSALLPVLAAQGKYTHNYKEVDVNFGQFNAGVLGLSSTLRQASTNPAEVNALAAYEQQLTANVSGNVVIQKREQLDGTLSATVPLIAPPAYLSVSAAKRTLEAEEANLNASKATILLQVAQAFYALAGAQELVVARRHAIEVAKRTTEDAKARFDSGTVNKVEVERAQVALLRAEQAEVEAADVQSQAYRSLATLVDLHEAFEVVYGSAPPQAPNAIAGPIPEIARRRPEVAALERSVAAADAQAAAAGWRWVPSLSGFGNLRQSNYVGFSGDHYGWAVGAQLDWVLYDGGTRDSQRHLAASQRRESEARLALLRDNLVDEIANGQRALETKRRALVTAQQSSELSRETLDLVRAQYDAGTATQIDLLQAQDSLVSAEVGLAQARFDLSLADLSLQRSLGLFPTKE